MKMGFDGNAQIVSFLFHKKKKKKKMIASPLLRIDGHIIYHKFQEQ